MSTKDNELKHDGCGCGEEHEHEHDTVTLTLEDGSDLECPIIDIFEIDDQGYIALLHPKDEVALLYRFSEDYDDDSIEITGIESDEEFDKVSKYMDELMEE